MPNESWTGIRDCRPGLIEASSGSVPPDAFSLERSAGRRSPFQAKASPEFAWQMESSSSRADEHGMDRSAPDMPGPINVSSRGEHHV